MARLTPPMERRAAAAAEITGIAEKLKAHGPFGSIRVVDVSGDLTTDQDGDAVLRLSFVLSDPTGGQQTWSLDDIDALQQEAQRYAGQSEIELPYVVTEFYPESPDPDEDAGDASEDELSRAIDLD